MKRIIFITLIQWGLFYTNGQAQITTFVLVRHAEKAADGTPNPDLSPEGKKRATALKDMLGKLKIHQIYATEFRRTQQTAEPIAQALNLTMQLYEAKPNGEWIEKLKKENLGKIALVVGHSNTIPEIVNLLTNSKNFVPLADHEYQNIFVVSLTASGESQVQIWQFPF
ncbi:MAG: histidine phosphatase family protein [Microscillaceae bacterium]|jgi:broad specificity phosphatase PhoE|nr:histidine phosphatase family protein [Microscillaceae bacterium]